MKCKIGIDFHGVINTRPLFFRLFCQTALNKNMDVYIISGGPYETINTYLKQYKIPYTKLWCIYDYYEKKGQITYFADGSFRVADELWNKAKAEYCRRENICVHIDDSTIYGQTFATPYCLYDDKENICEINGHKIILDNPEDALQQIMKYCRFVPVVSGY